jgi:hypothetical protein
MLNSLPNDIRHARAERSRSPFKQIRLFGLKYAYSGFWTGEGHLNSGSH